MNKSENKILWFALILAYIAMFVAAPTGKKTDEGEHLAIAEFDNRTKGQEGDSNEIKSERLTRHVAVRGIMK